MISDSSTTNSALLEPAPAAVRTRGVGVAMLVVASVLWSLSGVAVKKAGLPSVAFAFYRSIAAAALMAALLPLSTRFGAGGRPHAGWMALSAAIYTAVVSLLITAMTRGTAASGILLQYTGPIFCALFAWIFYRRAIGRRTALAMVVGTAGIAIMIAGKNHSAAGRGDWIAYDCGLLSGIAFGALILVLEKLDRASGGAANPVQVVFFNNLGAAIALLPIVAACGALKLNPYQLAIAGATGMVQLAAPYLLFQLALRRVEPVDASLLILLEPVLNPIWVAMATSERPDAATIIGGTAILLAMVLEATKSAVSTD